MQSMWNEKEAQQYAGDELALRVYTSRLIGRNGDLVSGGGGNTSLKTDVFTDTGGRTKVLYVKATGYDLAAIRPDGFSPVRLDEITRLIQLDTMNDEELMSAFCSALLDSKAPAPSIETLFHSIIPFRFVEHTHADAVVAITNMKDGAQRIRSIYGDSVIVVPYVPSGFQLAKLIDKTVRDSDWNTIKGIILLHHGVITFQDDARESYNRMIWLVTKVEEYLERSGANKAVVYADDPPPPMPTALLECCKNAVSEIVGFPLYMRYCDSAEARGFACLPNVEELAKRGPLVPGHIPLAKRIPIILHTDVEKDIAQYAADYKAYFERNTDGTQVMHDPAPRWGILCGYGLISFGRTIKEAQAVIEIALHTIRAIQWCEALGGWEPLSEREQFKVEYRTYGITATQKK